MDSLQPKPVPDVLRGPPVAAKKTHTLRSHGVQREDEYHWLRERDDPEVRAHLNRENAWLEQRMAPHRDLREELFDEITGRLEPEDCSVPEKQGKWSYYSRFEAGKQYRVHCRRATGEDGSMGREEILLDVNELAEGHEFCSVGDLTVSPDGEFLCYAEDYRGRWIATLRFKNLVSGELLEESIPGASGSLAWASDSRTIFYASKDPESLRSDRILRHRLASDPALDELVFHEKDRAFACDVSRSRTGEYLFIRSTQTISDEVRFLAADDPEGQWRVVQPRRVGLEYSVQHAGDCFLIRTNHGARNFRLMKAPIDDSEADAWREVVPGREDVYLASFLVFRDFLVLTERKQATLQLRVMNRDGSQDHLIAFDEAAFLIRTSGNREFACDRVRFTYESPTTPPSVYDYEVAGRERELRKQKKVGGEFERENYRCERLWIEARDGTPVPVTLVYHVQRVASDPAPLLLYGYGSYGMSLDPGFHSENLSLLDRGFLFAWAHTRGGQELGREWYEDGKLLRKRNTFNDFVDIGRALIAQGRTSSDRLFAIGDSAGGLLVGAVLNQAPELWRGAVAYVPFVDIVTTMEDDSMPLTSTEYDEWGDPANRTHFDYLMSYSPYDNVGAHDYPDVLVTTGIEDSQVQYWEPAKWVARLRDRKSGSGEILFLCAMTSGHGGPSGRFEFHRETALAYAFLLSRL